MSKKKKLGQNQEAAHNYVGKKPNYNSKSGNLKEKIDQCHYKVF